MYETIDEKIIKARNSKRKRTSIEWCDYFEIHPKDIIDPDGWDRANFHYDFFQKEITYQQFDDKIGTSTCQGIAWERYRVTIESIKNSDGDNGQHEDPDPSLNEPQGEVEVETTEESEPSNEGTS
ncbi:MAG: hypothetical protein ACFE95_13455 [Candidatus Hodarchaeota archaeon]